MRIWPLALALSLFGAAPAMALVQDCRGPGSIGVASMGQDGTITLNIRAPAPGSSIIGVTAYRKDSPYYAQVLSHVGGLHPGDRKPVPPWCNN